ncbi:MAG: MATE family efflux transporter [Clostridium sp.]|nr:MATE family efflux transporter [Clostridium sp.]
MNKKELFINLFSSLLALGVSIIMSFYLTPYITENVGNEAYGFYSLANKFVDYSTIITLALNSMASRFITIKIHQNNILEANKYFNSVLFSNIIITIILSIPAIIIIIFQDKWFNISKNILVDIRILFILVFINAGLSIIGSVFSVATFIKNKLYLSSLREIESNVIKVGLLLLLFKIFSIKVSYIGISVVISNFFICCTNIYYTKKLLPDIKISKKYFDFLAVKELIGLGIWNSITKLSQILLDGLDLLIASLFIGNNEMGILAIVKIIPSFLATLMSKVMNIFSPKLTEFYAKGKKQEMIKVIKSANKMQIIILSIPIAFVMGYGKEFFSLWMPSKDANFLQLLSVISMFGLVISGSIQILYQVFTLTNKVKVNSIVMIITGIFNTIIVLILLYTTNLGLIAIAGVSTILAIIRNLTFTPIYASKCLKVKWYTFYPDIFKGILTIFISLFLAIISRKIVIIDSWFRLISVCIITGIIALIVNFILNLNKDEKREIISKVIMRVNLKK